MVLVGKSKWYYRKKTYGMYQTTPYEDIIGLTVEEAVALLNSDAVIYYNELNGGGHLYEGAIATADGSDKFEYDGYYVVYNNGTWETEEKPPYGVYTIKWDESKSNPAEMFVGYYDDAETFTQGSTNWDKLFGYTAVLLDEDGHETEEIRQTSPGTLQVAALSNLTGGDNVMIKFPRRGLKISKDDTIITLSITDNPNAEGFNYYAFQVDGDARNQFYLGAVKATQSDTKLKSWLTGSNPTVYKSITDFRTAAAANGAGYGLITVTMRDYVNALYMLKYGNPDSQSVVGQGLTSASAAVPVGQTFSEASATYGTSDAEVQSRLFGLEDWWGNVYEWVDGIYGTMVNVTNNPAKFSDLGNTSRGWEDVGIVLEQQRGMWGFMSQAFAGDKAMFFPTQCNGSDSTYYCSYARVIPGDVASAGGCWYDGSYAGCFYLNVVYPADDANSTIGARLAYI